MAKNKVDRVLRSHILCRICQVTKHQLFTREWGWYAHTAICYWGEQCKPMRGFGSVRAVSRR